MDGIPRRHIDDTCAKDVVDTYGKHGIAWPCKGLQGLRGFAKPRKRLARARKGLQRLARDVHETEEM